MRKSRFAVLAVAALAVGLLMCLGTPGRAELLFDARLDFNVDGRDPYVIAKGDFNGDGRDDLVTTNIGSDTVSVFTSNADGTLANNRVYYAGDAPYPVGTGDVNGDGFADIAVGNLNPLAGEISVLLGNGDGTFQPRIPVSAPFRAHAITLADLNGDGFSDVAATMMSSHEVAVLLSNGNGTFQAAALYNLGSGVYGVASGDINNDGAPDLVAAVPATQSIFVLINNNDKTGGFSLKGSYPASPAPRLVTLADVNGDGFLDAATATSGHGVNKVSVLIGNGLGAFSAGTGYDVGNLTEGMTAGDFNGDGLADLATANRYSDGISLLVAAGGGSFQEQVPYHTGREPRSITSGDFNGDGLDDLAVVNSWSHSVSVFLGKATGALPTADSYSLGVIGVADLFAAPGDFNGDGFDDIAVASYSWAGPSAQGTLSVMIRSPDGSFSAPVNYPVGTTLSFVATGHLNADGHLDLVANGGSLPNTVSILLGNGDGAFQGPVDVEVGSNPGSVLIEDFNRDTFADLVVTGSNNVLILLGNGDGSFQPPTSYAAGTDPRFSTAGDFNGDGFLDVATANYTSRNISLFLGDGKGAFQPGPLTAVSYPYSITSGDFNRDGKSDLAVCSPYYGSLGNYAWVMLGNGDGTFGAPQGYRVGQFPLSIIAEDLNRDGKTDLAVASMFSSYVTVLTGDGTGAFPETVNYGVWTFPRSVAAGDFDGDGFKDLVTADSYYGNVSVLINRLEIRSPEDIIALIENELDGLTLPQGSETAINSLLDNVLASLKLGTQNAATNLLEALIKYIHAQEDKQLTQEEANTLEQMINEVLAVLE